MKRPKPTQIGVSVVLTNSEGKYLGVTRKDDHKDWGFPGGKVEPGETKKEALTRELLEETGLVLDRSRTVEICRMYSEKGDKLEVIYAGVAAGIVNHDEPHLVDWVSINDLKNGRTFGGYNTVVFSQNIEFEASSITI